MSDLYNDSDFRDVIDDMSDDAFRRLFALQELHLGLMQPGDAYRSDITRSDEFVTKYSTVMRSVIAGPFDASMVQDRAPDYLRGLIAGSVINFAKRTAGFGAHSALLPPSFDIALAHVDQVIMLSYAEVANDQPIVFSRQQNLGALGAVLLGLEPSAEGRWELVYRAQNGVALLR